MHASLTESSQIEYTNRAKVSHHSQHKADISEMSFPINHLARNEETKRNTWTQAATNRKIQQNKVNDATLQTDLRQQMTSKLETDRTNS